MSSPHRSIAGSKAVESSAPIPHPVEPGGVVEHTSDLRPTQGAPDMDSYERMLRSLDDIQEALRNDVYDYVYENCRDNLRDLMLDRYQSFTHGVESLRTHVDTIESRLVLCERLIPDRSADLTAEQMGAFSRLAAQLNQQRSRANLLRERGSDISSTSANARDVSRPSPVLLRPFHSLPTGSDRPDSNGLRREAHAREAQNTAPPLASHKIPYRPEKPSAPLAVTPFGHLEPLEPGIEPTKTLLQEFSHVVDYRLYRLDDTSILVSENDAGRIGKYVKRCQGIRPTMKTFDGSSPITLLSFLKDISINFNEQRLNEGIAVRVVAHFLERDAERLYTF